MWLGKNLRMDTKKTCETYGSNPGYRIYEVHEHN